MKLLVFGLIILSATSYARRDVDMKSFNESMLENIDKTLKDNPQVYERNKDITRKPASVKPENHEKIEEQAEKLEGFQDQMSQGGGQW